MGIVVYNGVSTEELGILVENPPDYEVAERDYEIISIPGKHGDVVIDRGGYKNVERSYNLAFGENGGNFAVFASRVSGWLQSGYGYKRLEDSYEPDYYMMARVSGSNSITNIEQQAGRLKVTFDRKPQRFLKIGDHPIEFTKAGSVYNPTIYPSEPIIKVYGSGTGRIFIGNYDITISNLVDGVTIDSEIQEVYSGYNNFNKNVNFLNSFPKLQPKVTDISFSGGVTKLIITPRWWVI